MLAIESGNGPSQSQIKFGVKTANTKNAALILKVI